MAGKAAPTTKAPAKVPVESAQTDEQKRREAYSAATARLRDSRKDEFRALVLEEAAKRGVTYEFRKTAEERAREQVQALLAQHPNLAVEFRSETDQSEDGQSESDGQQG